MKVMVWFRLNAVTIGASIFKVVTIGASIFKVPVINSFYAHMLNIYILTNKDCKFTSSGFSSHIKNCNTRFTSMNAN